MGAILVQQAKKFKLYPGGSWELTGWGVTRRQCCSNQEDQSQLVHLSHLLSLALKLPNWCTLSR